ncbi:hypothetical protein [Paraburkholderia terrae]
MNHDEAMRVVPLIKFVELIASRARLRGETTGIRGVACVRVVEKREKVQGVSECSSTAQLGRPCRAIASPVDFARRQPEEDSSRRTHCLVRARIGVARSRVPTQKSDSLAFFIVEQPTTIRDDDSTTLQHTTQKCQRI